jgi:chemotaxis protein histidine kinase CheA
LIEDLHAKFLPQFIKIARTRLALAISAATQRDRPEPPSRELHTLVGEAGLLGLGNVVTLTRDCERKAKQWEASRRDADAEVLVLGLRELERVIEDVAAKVAPDAHDAPD